MFNVLQTAALFAKAASPFYIPMLCGKWIRLALVEAGLNRMFVLRR